MAEKIYPTGTTKTYLRAEAGLPPLPAELPEAGPSIQSRWKDLIKGVEEMSTTELAERAVGALGPGILKPLAAGRVLIGGGKRAMAGKDIWPYIRELLRAPQKELSRVRDIRTQYLEQPVIGKYLSTPRKIELGVRARPEMRKLTPWHELTHARQFEEMPFEEAERWYRLTRAPVETQAETLAAALAGQKGPVSPEYFTYVYREAAKRAAEHPDVWSVPRFLEAFTK